MPNLWWFQRFDATTVVFHAFTWDQVQCLRHSKTCAASDHGKDLRHHVHSAAALARSVLGPPGAVGRVRSGRGATHGQAPLHLAGIPWRSGNSVPVSRGAMKNDWESWKQAERFPTSIQSFPSVHVRLEVFGGRKIMRVMSGAIDWLRQGELDEKEKEIEVHSAEWDRLVSGVPHPGQSPRPKQDPAGLTFCFPKILGCDPVPSIHVRIHIPRFIYPIHIPIQSLFMG